MRHLRTTMPLGTRDGHRPRPRPRSWPTSSPAATRRRSAPCLRTRARNALEPAITRWRCPSATRILARCCPARVAFALPAELARTLGRLAQARFDTFDRQRPLVELVWSGATFPIDVQRQALAQALEDAQHYAAQHSGWLYLCGPCGAGKSHLAAAIAHTVATSGQGVTYASVPDLLRFVRRGFGEHTADERLDALLAIDVLILDDLGAEYLTVWAAEQLFVLLNARYLAERATVLTSNDRPDALPARLQSRIAELAQLIWMPISDYRQIRAGV
jgi:DNA replication protein DnaC